MQSNVSIAQWTADVAGSVKKEEDKKRMAGATITVKRNGTVWKTITADAKGRFDIPLLPGAVYMIEVSKPMHVTKRVEISTENVPPEDAKLGFDIPFDISLFEKMDGLDVSILDKPIGKIRFDPDAGYILSDAAYSKSIKAELDRLKKALAARLKSEEENRALNQKSYDIAIAAADKAFNSGKFGAAKPLYEKAAKIFPKETYPEFQLGDISDKLRAQEEVNKRYNSAISRAEAAFKARDWAKATSEFETAASLKVTEQYPKDKIKAIKVQIDNEKKSEKEYTDAIAAADQALTSKNYEKAKVSYQKASGLKSYEQYPKDKLVEIETALAEIAKKKAEEKAKNEKYKGLIAAADNLLGTKKYTVAKAKYKEAIAVKSEEQYPQTKISEIDGIVATIAKKEADYKAMIAAADNLLVSKDYTGAKGKYNAAIGIKSAEQYPKGKLTEIEGILAEIAKKEAEEKAKEAKYQGLIVAADNLLGSKDYTGAKGKYNEALEMKSAEQYPKGKLTEIEGILVEIAKKAAAEKAKEAKYLSLIASADKMLTSKNYSGAKGKYNEALSVKSSEQYPKGKLTEIEGILAEIARKAAAGKAKEAEYQGLISAADNLLSSKDYTGAKGKYNEALGVKSGEQYPKDKLAEIAKKEAAEKAKEAKYQGLIVAADNLLSSKDYLAAKGKYNEALGVKFTEQYPKDKLTEIEGALAEIARKKAEEKAREAKYQGLIVAADKMLGSKDYAGAKGKYNEALSVKSSEQYPKDKLTEIDVILAEIARKEAEEKAKEAKYKGLVVAADKMLGSKDYAGAKGKYNEALSVKSSEQYPKDKLKKIEGILAEIARKKAEAEAAQMAAGERDAKYDETIVLANAAFDGKKYEVAKSKLNEALGIKPGEQYPKDKLAEIEGILSEIAKNKSAAESANLAASQKEAKYNQAIKLADKAFTAKSFETAKGKYNEAIGIKPSEQYPKDQLAAIEVTLDEMSKKSAADAANLAASQKEEKYNRAVKLGNKALVEKNFDVARAQYNEAVVVKPREQYPKDKLAEIKGLLAKDAAILVASKKDAKYNKAIELGDKAFTAKSFEAAKAKYNEALVVKPTEQYPKDKLAEIEITLSKRSAEDALAAESERKKREYFDALIAEANGEFGKENYDVAKSKYNQALGVIPKDQYPKDKLKEIATILAGLKANKQNDALAKKQLEEDYKKLIAQGDNSFSGKNYKGAKPKYQKALSLKSGEPYPKAQLAEIERILNEIADKESEITLKNNAQKQKEEAYASFIKKGDDQFSSKQFRGALSNFKQALEIKSTEAYPKEKIIEINKLLADLAAKDKANSANVEAENLKRTEYNKIIYDADRNFRLKDYEKAKRKYNQALGIYPSEKYPKEKLVDIEALLNSKPKEDIIVKNTNNGDRAKISDVNEREIEKRMALMMGKSIVEKEKRLEKEKLDYNHQETIRISAGVERTIVANSKFETYTIQEKEFLKKQDGLNVDKVEAHYVYVDNLEEGDIIMKERSEELRASNRIEVEQIGKDSEKSKRRSRKMQKDKEVDVLELKSNVAKQEEIRLRASIGRTIQNENDIKRLAKDMNNMKLDRIDSYKDNVVEIAAFKEALNAVEAEKLKSAENDRQVNKKERDRVYEESRKDLKKQNKRYYKDIQKVDDFRNKVNKQDPLYRKGADKRRELSNSELTKEKNKLGEVTLVQKKKYEDFHLKLKEEQEMNNNFLADLQLLEKDKLLLANAALTDVYKGEKRSSENEALASKYSQGVTEETLESGNSVVIKRTKVSGNHVDVYERVFYKWGGSYFLKNGKNITQSLWDKESIE